NPSSPIITISTTPKSKKCAQAECTLADTAALIPGSIALTPRAAPTKSAPPNTGSNPLKTRPLPLPIPTADSPTTRPHYYPIPISSPPSPPARQQHTSTCSTSDVSTAKNCKIRKVNLVLSHSFLFSNALFSPRTLFVVHS